MAQPIVDITLARISAEQIEIRLRPDGDFAQFFSSSVFTLRWEDGSGAELGSILQQPIVALYHAVARSGPEYVDNGYRYQIFAGFGGATMADAGANWTAGQEVVLCTLNISNGPGEFEITNDAFTGANNGSYYISLNGLDRTGDVYLSSGLSVNEVPAQDLSVMPNPSSGLFQVRIPGGLGLTGYTVADVLGRMVRTGMLSTGTHTQVLDLDLTSEPSGTYLFRTNGGEQVRDLWLVHTGH